VLCVCVCSPKAACGTLYLALYADCIDCLRQGFALRDLDMECLVNQTLSTLPGWLSAAAADNQVHKGSCTLTFEHVNVLCMPWRGAYSKAEGCQLVQGRMVTCTIRFHVHGLSDSVKP
jgi:hypothetical protein